MITNILLLAGIPATVGDSVPLSIAEWLGCMAVVLIIANSAVKLLDRAKDKPSPGEVRGEVSEKFVTKVEFRELMAENKLAHDRFDVRLGGVDRKGKEHADEAIERLRGERKQDMTQLHTEVNDLRDRVSGLQTETKNQTAWLERMDAKLDDLMKEKADKE